MSSTISPARFSPPVVSLCTSAVVQQSSPHTSQANGGLFGSTPMPSASAATVSRIASPDRLSAKPR